MISDLTHEVNIVEHPSSPLLASSKYTLTCTVTSDFPPTVKWLDPENNEVNGSDGYVTIGQPTLDENCTTLVLSFDPVKISHGGVYSCISTIKEPYLQKKAMQRLTVQSKSNIGSFLLQLWRSQLAS